MLHAQEVGGAGAGGGARAGSGAAFSHPLAFLPQDQLARIVQRIRYATCLDRLFWSLTALVMALVFSLPGSSVSLCVPLSPFCLPLSPYFAVFGVVLCTLPESCFRLPLLPLVPGVVGYANLLSPDARTSATRDRISCTVRQYNCLYSVQGINLSVQSRVCLKMSVVPGK